MVYHNLSMSLNHHVPILNCTVTTRGSSFSRSDTWLTFKLFERRFAGISPSHTHTQTDWLTPTSKSQAPPLRVTLPVFLGSCDLALYRLWALWFWICISSVHLCTLQMFCTEANGSEAKRENDLFVVTVFRPFLMEGTQALVYSYGCFLSSLSFTGDRMLLSAASCVLKLIMNTKIYSSSDLEGEHSVLLFA